MKPGAGRVMLAVCGIGLWGAAAMGQAVAPAAPRVALWATALNADSEKYLDVAVAELTARGGIELVERQAIRAVLSEQSQALRQDASGVAAGKLLRADLIGVLETTPDGKEAGGFAVLDTATGVSYWNQGLESSGVEDVAREIVRGVEAALEKRSRAGSLSTVCMLGARNAEFPRSLDVFCETVAYLLDRRLVENPSVTTLDRRRLEAVISENRLPGVEDQGDVLLPSLRLVELDFRRGVSEDEIKVLARVTDAGGALIAQPEVTGPRDAVALVEPLQAALAEVLHATPQVATGDRAAEAKRFRTQGIILWERGLREQAIQSLDAAYALAPGIREDITAYVDRLIERANGLAREKDYENSMGLIRRALDVETTHQVWHSNAGGDHNDPLISAMGKCKRLLPDEGASRDDFHELRQRYKSILGLTTDPAETSRVGLQQSLRTCYDGVPSYYSADASPYLQFRVTPARTLCMDSGEFYGILNARLEAWFKREADPAQPHDAGIVVTLNGLCGMAYQYVWDDRGWIPFDDGYVRGLRDIAARFQAHPRLVVRLEGLYFTQLIDACLQGRGGPVVDPDARRSASEKTMEMALAGTSDPSTPPGDIPVLYELAARMAADNRGNLDLANQKEWSDAQLHRMAMTMFDHHHISGTILLMMEHRQMDFERYRKPMLWRLKAVQNDRTYQRFNLSRRDLKDLLRVLPAATASPAAASSQGDGMAVLWQTPAPQDWRNRLVGLHIENERFLYAYSGYMGDFNRTRNPKIGIHRIDLADGRMEKLGQIQVNLCWPEKFFNLHSGCPGEFIEDSVCTDTTLWLATSGDGLYGIPLAAGGGEPIHIGMADGLPHDNVHSVLPVGDDLYIGCGQDGSEGYLVRYDPDEQRFHVMVSTLRASPECPLDSLPNGFHLQKMVHDEPRNRLLLMVNGKQGEGDSESALWEYRMGDGGFRSLLEMGWPAREVKTGPNGVLELYLNRVLTSQYVFWYGIVEFDPTTDAGRMRFANQTRGASDRLPMTPDTCRYRNLLYRSNALGEGWLYHFGQIQKEGVDMVELRRISLATREVQPIPGQPLQSMECLLDSMQGKTCNLFYWGWLRWLPESRVLIIGNGGQFTAVKMED